MSPRRSIDQRRQDDEAFPIRVKFRVPSDGLGREIDRVVHWLNQEVGRGNFAQHPATISYTRGGGGLGVYFRRIADAARFLEAFPNLEIADGTEPRETMVRQSWEVQG